MNFNYTQPQQQPFQQPNPFNQPTSQPSQFTQFNQMNQPNQFNQGNQFNQQENPMMNQQFNQANILQQQQMQNEEMHRMHIKQTLSHLFQLQNQPQFQQLIQILITQQRLSRQQMEKTMESNLKQIQPKGVDQLFKRGQRIREKNTLLLNQLLLVKAKLERLMYKSCSKNPRLEYETAMAMDKIRVLKSDITQKCAYLKTLKVNKSVEGKERRSRSVGANFSNVGTALTELKKGAEVLEREVLRQKTEMEFVVGYLNQGK